MKQITSLIFILLCSLPAQGSWFKVDNQKYSVQGEGINPAAFFEQFSLQTGIGVQFDSRIHAPLDLYFSDVNQNVLIRFIESEYSVMSEYDKQNNLISMVVLPKGEWTAQALRQAVNPIKEGVYHRSSQSTGAAYKVYLSRLDRLKSQYRERLDQAVELKMESQSEHANRKHLLKQRRISHREEALRRARESLSNTEAVDSPVLNIIQQSGTDTHQETLVNSPS